MESLNKTGWNTQTPEFTEVKTALENAGILILPPGYNHFAKAKAHAKRIKLLAKTQICREIERYTADDRQWPNEMDDI